MKEPTKYPEYWIKTNLHQETSSFQTLGINRRYYRFTKRKTKRGLKRGFRIRMALDLSPFILKAKKKWRNIFTILKEFYNQPHYQSIKREGIVEIFSDVPDLKEIP